MRRFLCFTLLAILLLDVSGRPLHAAPARASRPANLTCLQISQDGFSVHVPGFVRYADGTIEFIVEVTADQQTIANVMVVARGLQVVKPALGSTFAGHSGLYDAIRPLAPAEAGFQGIRLVARPPALSGNERFEFTLAHVTLALPAILQITGSRTTLTLALDFIHPVCDRTPPVAVPVASLPQPSFYQSHVIVQDDFGRLWTDAERAQLWDAGLPVPDQAEAIVDVFAATVHLPALPPIAAQPAAADGSGWSTVYRQSYDAGFPNEAVDGPCRLVTLSNDAGWRWDSDAGHTDGGSAGTAAPRWIAPSRTTLPATGLMGLNETVVQMACVFDGLARARNLMVQFAMRIEAHNAGDSFFAGISTDGRTFQGRRWRSSPATTASAPRWSENRLFVPFIGERAAVPGGRVAVLWEYRMRGSWPGMPGIWLDNIVVEQYDPPPLNCRGNDPTVLVPGTPGNTPVSKGLNLSPYPSATPSGLAGHVARLSASGADWVRLEFQALLDLAVPRTALAGPGGRLNYIDLKHYDTLLYLLCTAHQPIAVLGLLDYNTLPDDGWRLAGRVDSDYLAGFEASAHTLVRYYQDRVRAWEIWNEPDFSATYLAPGDYARLLGVLFDAIKAEDAGAKVVFGGLGGADWVAKAYFQRVLAMFLPGQVPYDVFAIHPYPSKEFRHGGTLIRDPSYLRYQLPTVLAPFMDIMRVAGQGYRPIWITEIGWNRAADSSNQATLTCRRIYETMVTGADQALYLPAQFDILFKETAWAPGVPSVTKIFWYQYADVGVGVNEVDCENGGPVVAGGPMRIVDWWYGLYSGTDPAHGVLEPLPNLSECTFRSYPDPVAMNACLPPVAAVR